MSGHPLLPFTKDRDTEPFFAAAAEGRLVYLRCETCDHAVHPPMRHCPHCGGWTTIWQEASGEGHVRSWTTVVQTMHPGFPAPYTLAVVELADAPEVRLMARLDGDVALRDGQPMTVWFEPLEGGGALPQWAIKKGWTIKEGSS